MDTSTRREFLQRSAALSFIAAGIGFESTLSAAEPIKRVGGSKLKVSLNAFCFNQLLLDGIAGKTPSLSLFDVLDFCAEQNFDAIDPTGYYFPGYPAPPSDEYIAKFKRRAFELGLDISGTGIRNDFATPDESVCAADVARARLWVEASAKLGAPVLRVFAGAVPADGDWDAAARRMAAALKQVAEHGSKFGVLIGVQNHGDMLKTAAETIKVLDMVDSNWLGVVVDIGSFKTPDPYVDVAAVMPYAVNMQVKESPFGKESNVRTDLKRLMKIIRDSNYRGYLPIETLSLAGRPYDPKKLVPPFLAEVRAAIEQTG